MANLEEICRRYEAAGLYTHVYASCGFLHEDSSKLHFALLPDNRDVFDLASLTKALVTTPLAIWFCQRASHELNSSSLNAVFGCTAVESLWPEAGKISLADLLRHESGLPAWRNFYVECEGQRQTIEDVLTRLGKAPAQNGTPKDVYSDIGFILLGRLLEKAGGNKLIEQWWEACDQEGIKSARKLGWQGSLTPRHAISTGYCPVRQKNLVGEVHDENCWALGGFAGHAGLFGAGQDVEAFLKDLWSTSAGQDVFQANFAQISSEGDSLMGWRKGKDYSANSFAEGRGCGHMGFTGTAFWVDPKTKAYALLLANRVISGRISPVMKEFRRDAFGEMWNFLQRWTK